MKRLLSVFVVILLLLCLLASCNFGLLQLETDSQGFYQLYTPEDLLLVAGNPKKDYILMQDIDMTGVSWEPITDFSGIFDGNDNTVSNLTIQQPAKNGEDMGFFGNITQNAEVVDFHLQDITVEAEDTQAENIGTVVGVCSGTVIDCTATGKVCDTRQDAEGETIFVGALVGKLEEGAMLKGGDDLSVIDDNEVYTTHELAADVALFVADSENVSYGLAGDYQEANQISGLWRDSFFSSRRQSEQMRQRQAAVVDKMYAMGTTAWSVPATMIHDAGTTSDGTPHIHSQTFEPGQTYYGIPYNHTARSYEAFMHCLDENNQVKQWVVDLGNSQWKDGENVYGFTLYMGNDCSSAVGWAWQQVSPAVVDRDINAEPQNGVYVCLTNQMIPNGINQETYGIYPVGSWDGEAFRMKTAIYKAGELQKTSEIIAANGQEKMYEAYARARKADGLINGNPGGHARLIAADPVVIRNADGTIEPNMSYMLVHEQGDGLYNNRYEGTNSSWRINYRYTFNVLLNGSTKKWKEKYLEAGSGPGYLPITIHALRQETVPESYVQELQMGEGTITAPATGFVYSNYQIASTIVTIKDSLGAIVYDKEVFVGVDGDYDSIRGINTTINLETYHRAAVENLPAGSYTFTVQARLSDNNVRTVVENRSYEHK